MASNTEIDFRRVARTAMSTSGYTPNVSGADIWAALGAVGMGASAYHGYKRNEADNAIVWALWWGFWGAILPIVTIPVAIAQGFGKPAAPVTPNAAAGVGYVPGASRGIIVVGGGHSRTTPRFR